MVDEGGWGEVWIIVRQVRCYDGGHERMRVGIGGIGGIGDKYIHTYARVRVWVNG